MSSTARPIPGDHRAVRAVSTVGCHGRVVRGLPRSVTWRSAVVVACGATLLVTVSLGPMAAELGNLSVVVWLVTALVGTLQCLILAELAGAFPARAGGTATYAHEALGSDAPLVSALSSWSYWVAWTPGIAVNLILAVRVVEATVRLPGRPAMWAVLLALLLYGVNARGLRFGMGMAAVLAVLALIPLLSLLVGLLARPSLLSVDRLIPLTLPEETGGTLTTAGLLIKWTFVAAWSAYGAEMASTVVAEMRDVGATARRAMMASAAVGMAGFGLLPILVFGAVDATEVVEDPAVALRPVAQAVLGPWGGDLLGLMFAAGLVLGAHAFIVGSSRTIYQMSVDGHLPGRFAAVNRFGVPIGSIVWDLAVLVAFLLLYGERVIDMVAAANVAYLIVFVLLPSSYLRLVRRGRRLSSPLPASRGLKALAAGLLVFNAVILVLGGLQWGGKIVTSGILVVALVVAASGAYRWRVARPELLRWVAHCEWHALGRELHGTM